MVAVADLERVRDDLALHRAFPALRVPTVRLGEWPTPLVKMNGFGAAFVKRDDLSSPTYGGNKVRCLEFLFGEALERGATHVEAIGAKGTNHGVATLLHAARVGLSASATVFPQPKSRYASENYRVLQDSSVPLLELPHWFFLPFAMPFRRRFLRARGRPYIMPPGGATPRGALAYLSAALELVDQLRPLKLRELQVTVGVGSTCTAAGLLAGFRLAHERLDFPFLPTLVAVRVTPWPVTSAYRIAKLASQACDELADLCEDDSLRRSRQTLQAGLHVNGDELGRGYGHATDNGRRAIDAFASALGYELDTTYSAKAAAAFLQDARVKNTPQLFWSTKSSVPLPGA